MRVAWFTPMSKRTGIAKYSLSLVKALSKKVEVDVWTAKMPDNVHMEDVTVYEAVLNNENINKLYGYDIVVYNMGNSVDFHYEIYEFYTKVKGLVILHDKVLHHFFAGYYLDKRGMPDKYVSIMDYLYGAIGRKTAQLSLNKFPPVWETEDIAKYPLFEHVLLNSYGIIVHAKDMLAVINEISPVPAINIYHPFYNYPSDISYMSREQLGIPDDTFVLLQYGHVNSNKNIHKVLEVLSNSRDILDRVHFIIVGDNNTPYGNYVKKFIDEKGLEHSVLLTGHVSDDVLYSYIQNADVCINLRFPSTEGASGSLIEQFYFRKPIIGTKVGFYAEIPDECILKIDVPINTEELSNAIKLLIENKEYRDNLATQGSKFAYIHFSPDEYAKNFIRFVQEVLSCKTIVNFMDSVSDEISNFITPKTSDSFLDSVANEINTISEREDRVDEQSNEAVTIPIIRSSNICDSIEFIIKRGCYKTTRSVSLKENFINFWWRHKNTIKKIPVLNSISKKLYHSVLHDN